LYIESSAVLRWLLTEAEHNIVAASVQHADTVVSSALTGVEVERALISAEALTTLKSAQRHELQGAFAAAQRRWILMEINADVRKRASEPFPVEPVRALDAIHLATALEFLKTHPNLAILSFDHRIRKNLAPLGLTEVAASA